MIGRQTETLDEFRYTKLSGQSETLDEFRYSKLRFATQKSNLDKALKANPLVARGYDHLFEPNLL